MLDPGFDSRPGQPIFFSWSNGISSELVAREKVLDNSITSTLQLNYIDPATFESRTYFHILILLSFRSRNADIYYSIKDPSPPYNLQVDLHQLISNHVLSRSIAGYYS